MEQGEQRRRATLEDKARRTGLSEAEATELADLERGGPQPVPSKLIPPSPHAKPWTAAYWRGRALGPLGALLVLAGLVVVLIGVFVRRPAIEWLIYEDPAFTFAIQYPRGWKTTPVSEVADSKDGERARRVDAVLVTPSQDVPNHLGGAFALGYRGPVYG
ncbi:MAG: hypothetical protein ABR518_03115, partial [Actinomycetota bacterium]